MSQRNTRSMTMANMTDFEFWSHHANLILKKMCTPSKAFLIAEIAKVPRREASTGELGGDTHLELILKIRLRKLDKKPNTTPTSLTPYQQFLTSVYQQGRSAGYYI